MIQTTIPHFRVLCFGVGAIGTYIGGSLALIGQDVTFVERPEVAEEVNRRGLRLGLAQGELQVSHARIVPSVEAALDGKPYDFALFAVKSYDTRAALDGLAPYVAALPPVLCLQNGVENEQAIAALLGENRVIAGTVTTAVGRRAAGDIYVERLRGMGVALEHPLATHLVPVLDAAGLQARGFPNAAAMKWSKMLTNLMANATSAILNLTPAEIFAHPGLYALEVRQMREALAVMKANGIGVTDLPGTPVHLLVWVLQNLPLSISQPLVKRALGAGRGGKMPSFHIDLYGGRKKSEVEYLNGAVVRYGQRASVPTPVNRLLTDTLTALAAGELPLETFARQPEKLLGSL